MSGGFTIGRQTIIKPEVKEGQRIRRADVAFVIDCTKTMTDVLDAVVDTIADIVAIYEKEAITVRLGLTEFRDQTNAQHEPEGRHMMHAHMFGGSRFTKDFDAFLEAVERLEAAGGGPPKESCYDAIAFTAMGTDWEDGADRVIVFFTDTRPNPRDALTQGICTLCPIVKNARINQLHMVVDLKGGFGEEDYGDVLRCVPNPNDVNLNLPGNVYDIGKEPTSTMRRGPEPSKQLQHLRDVLVQIARSSGSMITGSGGNVYAPPAPQKKRQSKRHEPLCPHAQRKASSGDVGPIVRKESKAGTDENRRGNGTSY